MNNQRIIETMLTNKYGIRKRLDSATNGWQWNLPKFGDNTDVAINLNYIDEDDDLRMYVSCGDQTNVDAIKYFDINVNGTIPINCRDPLAHMFEVIDKNVKLLQAIEPPEAPKVDATISAAEQDEAIDSDLKAFLSALSYICKSHNVQLLGDETGIKVTVIDNGHGVYGINAIDENGIKYNTLGAS